MTSLLQTEPTKVCSTCKQEKDVATNFHKNKNYRGGYTAQCKSCRLAAIKIWRKEHPEAVLAARKRYQATDKCKAMWKRTRIKHLEKRTKYLDSHVTGKNRGLLCEKHNMMLGLAGDSPELLRKAAEYLAVCK